MELILSHQKSYFDKSCIVQQMKKTICLRGQTFYFAADNEMLNMDLILSSN
jgi:hypothetical protein